MKDFSHLKTNIFSVDDFDLDEFSVKKKKKKKKTLPFDMDTMEDALAVSIPLLLSPKMLIID